MNYDKSLEIFDKINKAENILLNCHRNPDPDSIGSALAMKNILSVLGKKVTIFCPSKELFDNVDYLVGYEDILKGLNLRDIDFSQFDLFITLDSSNWNMVFNGDVSPDIKLTTVVIDHHKTNELYGDINLVDENKGSTAEMLYLLFEDWKLKIDKKTADCLLAGIIGDTGAFRYPSANDKTFKITSSLMDLGADKNFAIQKIYRSEPYKLIKFYGEVLAKLEIDIERKFVYSITPYDIYDKYGKPSMAKESSASMFAQVVEDTDFGFIAIETEPKKLSISFRSRSGFDTSQIASILGGGGHIYASAARIEGMNFEDAKEKLLQTVRRVVDGKGD